LERTAIRAVEIVASDRVTLRGEAWGAGDDWLVLLHDAGADLDVWRPLMGLADQRSLSLLALDLRGHGGSEGTWKEGETELDFEAAGSFARSEGARTVCVAAAGTAALAALRAAPRVAPDALVLLSPGPLRACGTADLRAPGVAKLVLVGGLDPRADADAAAIRAVSIGPALVVSLPTKRQGTDLLSEPQAVDQFLYFVDEQRWAAGSTRFGRRSAGRT
jgi:pimeloyl-ACP methyl ester carboxylesterase